MAIDFPNSPSVGQIYSIGSRSWQWNGSSWESYLLSTTPTNALIVDGNATINGISTVRNSSGAVIAGIGTTALIVEGNARVTGILSVGQGTIRINGNNDSISGVSTIGVSTIHATSLNGGQLGGSRNMIINGAMMVNQRGFTGAAGTTTSNSYVTDRFRIDHAHDGAVSAGQTSMNSTVGGNAYANGFQNALFFNVTTADASLAAGQTQQIGQYIEGYNVQGIKKGTANAQQVTLSFWVRSTTTGTYIAELFDGDNTRQVSQAYTINAANTWEKKTLTFPADTTGVFDNDNALSLYVIWWLAAGSTYSGGTLNTSWAANTQANRAAGQTNLLATVGNNFWLTGVQLEVGSQATEFERRSYSDELALCQRYFVVYRGAAGANDYAAIGSGTVTTTSVSIIYIPTPVTLRASPTFSFGGTVSVSDGGVAVNATSVGTQYMSTSGGAWLTVNHGSGLTIGRGAFFYTQNATTNFCALNSEL